MAAPRSARVGCGALALAWPDSPPRGLPLVSLSIPANRSASSCSCFSTCLSPILSGLLTPVVPLDLPLFNRSLIALI